MGFTAMMHDIPMAKFYFVKDVFRWIRKSPDSVNCDYSGPGTLSLEDHRQLTGQLKIGGHAHMIAMSCWNGALAYGPKILKLTNVDFEILEKTDVNLLIADYSQPFPTMVIEFPENYAELKRVADPLEGQFHPTTGKNHTPTHRPAYCVIQHHEEAQAICMALVMTSYDVYSILFSDSDKEIQFQLREKVITGSFRDSLPITEGETSVYYDVATACLNACLYVMDSGYKSLGPENPSHHKRLQHYQQQAVKSKDPVRIAKANKELLRHPKIFAIEQDVRLSIGREYTGAGESGYTLGAHWRRGHYKMQPHGPGNSQRKRIRIKAYLVNGDKFKGDDKDTTYQLRD